MTTSSNIKSRMHADGYVGVTDAARIAQVHHSTVYRWIESGVLDSLLVNGRSRFVRASALVAHLAVDAKDAARIEDALRALGVAVHSVASTASAQHS